MSEYRFKVGQAVEYHPPRGLFAPRGPYIVTAALPTRFGEELEYRIKHSNEQHERVAKEDSLLEAAGNGDVTIRPTVRRVGTTRPRPSRAHKSIG